MNKNDKMKKGITESALLILLMALYIVYGINYLPLLTIFLPLPFVILGIRHGIQNNIISIAITCLIMGVILGSSEGVILLLVFTPLSIGLNYLIKSRKKTGEILLFSTILVFLSFLAIIYLGNQATNFELMKEMEESFLQGMSMQEEIFKEMGMTNHQIVESTNLLEKAYEYMMMTLPAIFAIISLFVSYINYLFVIIILRRTGYEVVSSINFSRFKLPNNIILGTGFMFLAGIIMGKLEVPYHNALLANISVLVGFVFLLQGLSVLDFLLIKRRAKLIIRVILLGVGVIVLPISSLVIVLGILDSIFDLRKIGRRKSL